MHCLLNISNVILVLWLSSLDKPLCNNHAFCFLYSNTWTRGVLLTQEGFLLQGLQKFLEMVNSLPSDSTFQMQTNQSRTYTHSHLLDGALSLSHYLPAQFVPGPVIRQLGTASLPQSTLKLCRIFSSKVVDSVLSFFPKEPKRKAFVHRYHPFFTSRSWHITSSIKH